MLNAAVAFEQSANPMAYQVAVYLRDIEVPNNWHRDSSKNVGALAHLPKVLQDQHRHPLSDEVSQLAKDLAWTSARLSHDQPASFKGDYCYTQIVGPGQLVDDERFRFGVYLQTPGTFYPSHKHEAVELYFPIAGSAKWQTDNLTFQRVANGTPIHHASYQPHATQTTSAPMLALWAWTGNLDMSTYRFVNQQ